MFFMVHFVLQNIYSIFCNKIVPCKLFFDVCSTRNPLVYVETIIYMVICCNTGDVFCNNNFRHVLKLVNVIELPGNKLDRILCIILYLLSTIFLCSCVFSRILVCKTKHHIHTSEYISHRQKHDFTIKSIPPGAHAFERIRLCQQQKSGFCKKSDLFKKQVGCVHSQIVEKCV